MQYLIKWYFWNRVSCLFYGNNLVITVVCYVFKNTVFYIDFSHLTLTTVWLLTEGFIVHFQLRRWRLERLNCISLQEGMGGGPRAEGRQETSNKWQNWTWIYYSKGRIQCLSYYSRFSHSSTEFIGAFGSEISCFISGNLLWLPALQRICKPHMKKWRRWGYVSAPSEENPDPRRPPAPLTGSGKTECTAQCWYARQVRYLVLKRVRDAWASLWFLGKNTSLISQNVCQRIKDALLGPVSQRNSFSLRWSFLIGKWGGDRDI